MQSIISSIVFVFKEIFVTQTIILVNQNPSTPIECDKLISSGRAEIRKTAGGISYLYITIGDAIYIAPATTENIKKLAAFISIYEVEIDDKLNPHQKEIDDSKKEKYSRNIKRFPKKLDELFKGKDDAQSGPSGHSI